MVIRKSFRFEGAHVVRNCVTERCSLSIHGHSYVVEVFVSADGIDNGQMIIDFSLLKKAFHPFVDSFDHSLAYWQDDDPEYIDFIHKYSARWVSLPVSPSAEMLSLVFLTAMSALLGKIELSNGEKNVHVVSVRVHETASGYAESFASDLQSSGLPKIDLQKIIFSEDIKKDWPDRNWWQSL
ncbi:MAG: 6-carboxytetrahydropterin synthase [Leptospiraceae bacterium]|nr:6-carboxytetrahydropterin synthase [Leptospiraceae bacterium]